jgi:plasmid stability protein
MKRRTVTLPDDLDALLRYEAARRGVTISDVIREALREHLGVHQRRTLDAAAAGGSGRPDVSKRIEEILREELGDTGA